MALTLRPSTPSDLPAITRIYGHAVVHGTASFEVNPPDLTEMTARRAALVEAGFPYLVAAEGEEVLGYAYAGLYRTRPAYRSTVEDSIYVAPEAQGRGIGRMLLTRLLAECESLGFRLVVAVIGDKASMGSIRLHEALGFQLVGTLEPVGYKHGRWLATVLMQRELGEGAATAPTIPLPG